MTIQNMIREAKKRGRERNHVFTGEFTRDTEAYKRYILECDECKMPLIIVMNVPNNSLEGGALRNECKGRIK